MGILIRTMRMEDCETVAMLDGACFPEAWSEAGFHDALRQQQYLFLILEKENRIMGYISMLFTHEEGEITRVALLPEYRRQGYGSMLMDEIMKRAQQQGVTCLFLEVRKSNHSAIALYQKFGFEQIGIRKNYYKAPMEDAVIMKKEL